MAGTKYNVTAADFQKAQEGFHNCSNELQKTMHTLEGELLGHLLDRSKYMGAQANAFSHTYGLIRDEMYAANQELTTMSELIRTASQAYTNADNTHADHFKGVGNSLGSVASVGFPSLHG